MPRRSTPSLFPASSPSRRKGIRLVVATDFSPTSRRALLFATRLAGPGGKLLLLHAIDPAAAKARGVPPPAAAARALLAREARACHARGLRCRIRALLGRPERVIPRATEAFRAAALLCGSHGRRGLRRLLLGSVAERLLLTARRPVIVVPHVPIRDGPRRVLAATDFSRTAGAGLGFAAALARRGDATLGVVHVQDTAILAAHPYTMGSVPIAARFEEQGRRARARLAAIASRLERAGVRAIVELEEGYPPDRILAFARRWGAELLVVGSRGLGGVGRFLLGSTSRELVRASRCPVAVVPGERSRKMRRGTVLV